ncbi:MULTISPECIES: MarR family winged helix-turn-helix transcriptional regulator [Ochrobactrum]|jgi:DNA-binding MarR family transcriptional regulator|uniref:MarR family transcriptional regulator n=1 Tax=Ochrobactrum quorumnocens TaxID=271865 RepID=A0A248UGD7_9HYPH|nr:MULTISPECIES: MarR family transcriptional regulator [Brucella/Ochrobactrum group]MBD7993537.1 MarR family transcriptional regulator [Ochrobactrum gallinarum]ASV85738.1 winged helix DNA-binding domain protein [[Ochrobactrum] quorumnocens]KAA9361664.1 MarR family transcriptional regulator [[Ochrobactrum] quorumnocens]MCV9909139.1 MarR family transcriptional regulator [Brucella sp. HL-2]MDH7789335.1 DNA-binding MarR family transcriptional regulator [Ochrobactrum sp. AN78]
MSTPCICILLRQAARKSSAIYDEALAPLGINIAQFSLLRKISRAGSISLTELAHKAELDRSTMGRNAKVLQRMGLVEPAASEDHRETSVTLTDEGRDIVRRGAPLWDKAQDEIEARLGDDGVEQLQSLLRAIS